MYEVTVEDTFAAGHYLRNYKGKCENPHGHNYKIRVTLAGAELDKAGLLLDFKDLKDVMKHAIDRLDHQMINDIEPFTVLNPSAENLAKYFYDETKRPLKERNQRQGESERRHRFRNRYDHGSLLGVAH
jgi:6-pyruvoyltetrahydropterin/6-carboxytetrahydropterin synthase